MNVKLLLKSLMALVLLLGFGLSASAQTTISLPATNYSPNGAKFTSGAQTIDWSTQEVYLKVDLSNCSGTNENIISIGYSDISQWFGGCYHIYYTPSESRFNVVYCSTSSRQFSQDLTISQSTPVEIVVTRENGITINGTTVGTLSAASSLFASSTVYIGSQEGSNRSNATYSEISIKKIAPAAPAAPTFDPAAGKYTATQRVTISGPDGATIYYTTDGTEPTTSSKEYSDPVVVSETTTLKAIAVVDGVASNVSTATYTIDDGTSGYSPTASQNVYDFSGFDTNALVRLFKKANDEGNKYPTDAEFEAAGIQQSDLHFIRSHVRYRPIMDRSDCLLGSNISYKQRNLWMNIPMDVGKQADVGQPNGTFKSDVFSVWNYTNIFGSWNHSIFGCPSAWVDAAHRNGTYIYSGIKFFDSGTGSANTEWQAFVTTRTDGSTFDYAEPMINALMYFNHDGINYNWEASNYTNTNVVAFHQQLHKLATANGYDEYHSGIYTSAGSLSSRGGNALFGNKTGGRTHDLMLNYSGGDFQGGTSLGQSAQAAQTLLGTYEGLYAGVWVVTMNRSWSALNYNTNSRNVSVCLWGEHNQSRFWSYTSGDDDASQQANYQRMLERIVSGGNQNPLNRPAISDSGNEYEGSNPMSGFAGLATWIPERSAIQGNLPFQTHFNLGNGDRYSYKGKKTAGAFYNMSEQDIVPTYRWLVVQPGTTTASSNLTPRFYSKDQYTGGTCLRLTGTPGASGTDVVLFKTSLNVSAGNPYVKVAVKDTLNGGNASNLYVILKKANGTWIEVPFGATSGKTWQEKQISVSALAQSDVITAIGLRVKSASPVDLLVGKLEVNDDITAEPAGIKNLNVEVKQETKVSLTPKLWWDVDQTGTDRADWDLTFNDEVNIDHFEVVYKTSEEGHVVEVGRTQSWGDVIPNIDVSDAGSEVWIGVRAASTDLKTYSPVRWVKITRAAQSNLPDPDASGDYGRTYINSGADGYATAIAQRFVTSVTTTGATTNLNYSTSVNPAREDSTQYCDATDHVLRVAQGQTVSLTFKCYGNGSSSDGMRYCVGKGWIDLNGDHAFNGTLISADSKNGEGIGECGTVRASTASIESGTTWTFTIPSDAHVGTSRLRIVFQDAWFAGALSPTGTTSKGYSIDFGVVITGNTAGQREPVDIHDQGTADEPEKLVSITTGINDVQADGVSDAVVEGGKLQFRNADKAWVYSVDGALVSFQPKAESIAEKSLPAGVYVVKMRRGPVFRTQKVVIK